MYGWRKSPTVICLPNQKPFRLRDISTIKAVERWTLTGEHISTELVMGRYRADVKNFEHAKAIARAVFKACSRGDEFFNLSYWRWDNEPA